MPFITKTKIEFFFKENNQFFKHLLPSNDRYIPEESLPSVRIPCIQLIAMYSLWSCAQPSWQANRTSVCNPLEKEITSGILYLTFNSEEQYILLLFEMSSHYKIRNGYSVYHSFIAEEKHHWQTLTSHCTLVSWFRIGDSRQTLQRGLCWWCR